MDTFLDWTAAALAAYLAGCDLIESPAPTGDRPEAQSRVSSESESDIFAHLTHAQTFEQNVYSGSASPQMPGGFPESPPRLPLKRRARHQHGSPKRQKVSVERYKLGSPSPTGTWKRRHGKSGKSSPGDLEARVKIHLPHRALPSLSTPVLHNEASLPTFAGSSIAKDTEPDVQVHQCSTPGPTNLPPSSEGAASVQRQPLAPIADNAVIGRKRSAPAEFDEEVSMPHCKKYITSWMSEYIRLRAPSWREMLRVMQKARWRPFRPQVARYLSPAPHSAPSTSSRYGCANHISGDLPVETPATCSAHRTEPPSLSSPDDSLPFFTTTTPPYSPTESSLPPTPPDTPTPLSGMAYPDCFPSASQIPWLDKGKWRADASPERVAYRPDHIAAEDFTPAATDIPPSFPSPPPSPCLSPSFLEVSSSPSPKTPSYLLRLPTLRTDRPRPVSNSKQSTVRRKGFRRTKSTQLEPTKLTYLSLRSQVKWRLQEICPRKRLADRPAPQMKTHSSPPPPHPPAPLPFPVSRRTDMTRAAVPTLERNRRLKTTRPISSKMEYLRLRSEVRWHLKDLGFEKQPSLTLGVSTPPTQVHPVLVMIGSVPTWLLPEGSFHPPPPDPVVAVHRRTVWDANTRLSMLASLDSPNRAYRPRRRRKLIPGEPASMESVEFSGLPH